MSDESSFYDEITAGPERTARLRSVEREGVHGHYCFYRCPRRTPRLCGVPIKPLASPPHNPGWDWDGNESAPTLSPSIMCHECGWHGYVRAGQLVDA